MSPQGRFPPPPARNRLWQGDDRAAAAADLEHAPGLTEALELCMLLAAQEPAKFGRVAFAGTDATAGVRDVDLVEAQRTQRSAAAGEKT